VASSVPAGWRRESGFETVVPSKGRLLMPAYKMLVVEDDAQLRSALHLCLKHLGYSIWEASTCGEALALADHHKPDLILLDLGLPDGDGLAVAQELRRRPNTARIPIAVLTGQWLVGSRAEVLANLCAGIIPKPVTIERLERDLKLLMTRRRGLTRRFPRVPLEAPVQWRMRGGGEFTETYDATGVARTLSEGGLMVELPAPLAVASLLDLRVEVPVGQVIAVGKVVWSRFQAEAKRGEGAYHHGVQFMGMDPDVRASLRGLIQGMGSEPRRAPGRPSTP
jgi:CheY-like chemotaxis protein